MTGSGESVAGDRIYYAAEKLGFAILVDEDLGGSYEFDQLIVVRAPDGTLWAAHDAGCSCPTPFEDMSWPADWTEIKQPADIEPVIAEWSEYLPEVDPARSRVRFAVGEALR